jgi:hypothetical protein
VLAAAYWSQRPESREQAACRVADFFAKLVRVSDELGQWYLRGDTEETANQRLALDAASIAAHLQANRRDDDRAPIPELGFTLGAWNGRDASIGADLGSYNKYVSNAVVLSCESSLDDATWRTILMALIEVFDPDRAVVADRRRLSGAGSAGPWDVGWLTYQRAELVIEHADRK